MAAVITKGDEGKYVECFVHIFNNCRQDWSAVCAILQSVFQTVQSDNLLLIKVFLRNCRVLPLCSADFVSASDRSEN